MCCASGAIGVEVVVLLELEKTAAAEMGREMVERRGMRARKKVEENSLVVVGGLSVM